MIVVDANVLANSLISDGEAGREARRCLGEDRHWAAPQHVVTETFSAIRGLCLGKKITQERADDAIEALPELVLDVYDVVPFLPRMWQLSANLTAYDAAYVAVAETLRCPLVTTDARILRAPGLKCAIRVLPFK